MFNFVELKVGFVDDNTVQKKEFHAQLVLVSDFIFVPSLLSFRAKSLFHNAKDSRFKKTRM